MYQKRVVYLLKTRNFVLKMMILQAPAIPHARVCVCLVCWICYWKCRDNGEFSLINDAFYWKTADYFATLGMVLSCWSICTRSLDGGGFYREWMILQLTKRFWGDQAGQDVHSETTHIPHHKLCFTANCYWNGRFFNRKQYLKSRFKSAVQGCLRGRPVCVFRLRAGISR